MSNFQMRLSSSPAISRGDAVLSAAAWLAANTEHATPAAKSGDSHGGVSATVPKVATKAASNPGSFTQADIDRAVRAAVTRERARISEVFASPGSVGRERGCALLLAAPNGWSASLIARELPHLPTDRERTANASRGSSSAVSARAHEGEQSRASASDRWEKANAKIEGRTPKAQSTSGATTSDRWEKANARFDARNPHNGAQESGEREGGEQKVAKPSDRWAKANRAMDARRAGEGSAVR